MKQILPLKCYPPHWLQRQRSSVSGHCQNVLQVSWLQDSLEEDWKKDNAVVLRMFRSSAMILDLHYCKLNQTEADYTQEP